MQASPLMFRAASVFILLFSFRVSIGERKKEGKKEERKENRSWLVPHLPGSNSENHLDGALPAEAPIVGGDDPGHPGRGRDVLQWNLGGCPVWTAPSSTCPATGGLTRAGSACGDTALTPGFEHSPSLSTLPAFPTPPLFL